MPAPRLAATASIAATLLALTGCAPSGNRAACRAFEEAFSSWDRAMESASDDPAYAGIAADRMREGLNTASSSADGEVARALALASAALALWDFQRRSDTYDGDFREDFRIQGEAVAAACYAAGTSIRLDYSVSRQPDG